MSKNYFFHNTSLKFSYYLNFFKKNKKKKYKTTRAAKAPRYIKKKLTHNLTPLPLRLNFSIGVSLRRFFNFLIDIKSNTAAETQRRIKKTSPPPYGFIFVPACLCGSFLHLGWFRFSQGTPISTYIAAKVQGQGQET
ncbi:MAG: hypothetical protein ACFFG0_36130 [Candidatus Thorarchaeota archaeon]